MLVEEKVYDLKDEKLRLEVIWLHHDTPVVGHGGQLLYNNPLHPLSILDNTNLI